MKKKWNILGWINIPVYHRRVHVLYKISYLNLYLGTSMFQELALVVRPWYLPIPTLTHPPKLSKVKKYPGLLST